MSQAATARINGAKSNGPITAEGKAISSQNSLKHGLTSSRVVLPHESQEAYDKLEASLINRFKPADDLESELVQEMAAARWRLRRIEAMEAALFKKAIKQHEEAGTPDALDIAYAEVAESKSYRMLVRHAAQLRRAFEKAWKETPTHSGRHETRRRRRITKRTQRRLLQTPTRRRHDRPHTRRAPRHIHTQSATPRLMKEFTV